MNTGDNRTENKLSSENDDYLWDGSGAPDPEIEKLETLLREFRHDRLTPVFPLLPPEPIPATRWKFFLRNMRLFPIIATTAAALLAVSVTVFLIQKKQPVPLVAAGWDVSRLAGAPRIGQEVVRSNGATRRLGVGQVLETDGQSRASLQSEGIGQIEMEPGTRLRVLAMGSGFKRIALDHGTIHAFIWSPPGQFVVDTPSARTVDLGCAYTLQMDDFGGGLVRTSLGWVGFKLNGHESFIPAGAACPTRPTIGPGTPYFEDASADLRAALSRFDFEDNTPQKRAQDLTIILVRSRPRDALTLWHLLTRVDENQRLRVYDRLTKLAPPPAMVTREGILRLDQPMLDLWWNALGFDDISIWRHWEHSWAEAAPTNK